MTSGLLSNSKNDDNENIKKHYNLQKERSIGERSTSRIINLLRENGNVKKYLLHLTAGAGLDSSNDVDNKTNKKIDAGASRPFILDIACGKGGMFNSFEKVVRVSKVIGIDISHSAIVNAHNRYQERCQQLALSTKRPFELNLFVADCFLHDVGLMVDASFISSADRENKEKKVGEKVIDVAVCMSAAQYSCASEERCRQFFRNASCRLKDGGKLICTVPNPDVILHQLQQQLQLATQKEKKENRENIKFGNSIYSVEILDLDRWNNFLESEKDVETRELKDEKKEEKKELKIEEKFFGLRYNFSLVDSIDNCTEYFLHLPAFLSVAKEFGFQILLSKTFSEISSSQSFSSFSEKLFSEKFFSKRSSNRLSKDELQVFDFYLALIFQKDKEPT
jgi:mRNA (guanine-N7-)-methyltransferase